MADKRVFALFGNIYQSHKSASIESLIKVLRAHDAKIVIDKEFYSYVGGACHEFRPDGLTNGDDFQADIVVSMGGDGTFLETAARVGHKSIPILGINTGRLGFLSDITPNEVEDAINDIYNDNFVVDERRVLQVTVKGIKEPLKGCPFALNEVAVLKRDNSSMISIRVEINGEFLAVYQADGLIINTPTGSTGYALSVGGAIVDPHTDLICIVPVASHSLNARPIVLRDNVQLSLSVESRSHNFLVAIDGRSEACSENARLLIQKAPYKVRVIQRKNHSFYQTLRTKLMWSTDPREKQ